MDKMLQVDLLCWLKPCSVRLEIATPAVFRLDNPKPILD